MIESLSCDEIQACKKRLKVFKKSLIRFYFNINHASDPASY